MKKVRWPAVCAAAGMLAASWALAGNGESQAFVPSPEPAAAPVEARGRNAYRPTRWLDDEDYLRWPLAPADQAYARIDGARIKGYVRTLADIARKSQAGGNQYWGRITGTAADRETTDWVAGQFRRIGLEQVWVGTGTQADFIGRNVRGKAVVAYGFPNPGGRTNTALTNGVLARADEAGAAAVFVILGFPGNVKNIPQAGGTEPPARMPAFMIGNDDGLTIRRLIETGKATRLKVRLEVERREGLKTASVWGVLPGTSDENIAVMAHTDAFFEGAMDNASGVGTMLELAEYFHAVPREKRPRTMVFFTASAHHAPSGEDAGIRWIHNNRQDLFARTALLLNCEHTSQAQIYLMGNSLVASNAVSARRWYVGGSDALKAIATAAFRDFGVALYSEPERRPGGELSQVYMDAPGIHIIDHAIYHTDLDTPERVPLPGLEAAARAFARIIDEANTLALADLRTREAI